MTPSTELIDNWALTCVALFLIAQWTGYNWNNPPKTLERWFCYLVLILLTASLFCD